MNKLHFEFIIYNIIEAYDYFTNDYINIDTLRKVFDIFLEDFNFYEDTNYQFNFAKCFSEFIENYNIDIVNNFLEVDPEELIDLIEENVYYSFEDAKISEYLSNLDIYEAMGIPAPLAKTHEYFDLNKEIVKIYNQIIEVEQNGIKIPALTIYLKKVIQKLKAKFDDLDERELVDIALSISKYSDCLKEEPETVYDNFEWYQTLFGDQAFAEEILNYNKVYYYYNVYEMSDDYFELMYSFDDYSVFLYYFIIYLNEHIKVENDYYTKCILIDKFYHLMASTALEMAEDYYLKNNTLDGFDIDSLLQNSYVDETSFECIMPIVTECVLSIDYTDEEISKDANVYPEIITKILFIKCFLEKSLNIENKANILNTLKNSVIYERPNQFKVVRELINNFIENNKNKYQK